MIAFRKHGQERCREMAEAEALMLQLQYRSEMHVSRVANACVYIYQYAHISKVRDCRSAVLKFLYPTIHLLSLPWKSINAS